MTSSSAHRRRIVLPHSRANHLERVNGNCHAPSWNADTSRNATPVHEMKRGDLVIALDINCGTYERHTKRDEEGLMTFAMGIDTS